MSEVVVMTNTTTALPPELIKRYGILVTPCHIIIDGKDYLDSYAEINKEKLYQGLKRKENLPTTSVSSLGETLEAYKEASQKAKGIVYVAISSRLGMGYEAAIQARKMGKDELSGTIIEVIDSQTVGVGQLLIVLEAARAAAERKGLDEVVGVVNNMVKRVSLFSLQDTLFYLEKGGRIGKARHLREPSISTKTLIEIDASTGGVAEFLGRERTRSKIMEKLFQTVKDRNGNRTLHVAVAHANVPDEVEELRKRVLSCCKCNEFYISDVSPTTAVHTGEGNISFGFYSED